ncbi:MAG: biopolymer transporter ExbD [Parachlamydiaceae bacterium]|nr:biopolymer transporter ExbD [Parachlamydiaceae bacterium]
MARHLIKRKLPFEEPTVNLTPLIDVVFVILIMFIVLAPLLELEHVELADASRAPNSSMSVQESSPLAIHVHRDNSIVFRQQKISLEALALQLKEAKRDHPTARLQLFQDKGAYFGTYQSVKNAAEGAGFNELDLILKPS